MSHRRWRHEQCLSPLFLLTRRGTSFPPANGADDEVMANSYLLCQSPLRYLPFLMLLFLSLFLSFSPGGARCNDAAS